MNFNEENKTILQNEDDLETLKEKLFIGRNEGITLDYECPIEIGEEARIVDGFTIIPQALEEKMDQLINELLAKKYIQISNSSWCHRVRPVEKENGTLRLTTNFIRLNQKVPLDRYTLPNIDELFTTLKDQAYFSKIDLKDGFFQIPLRKEDCHKTAFRIKNRLYEWVRMPMGFKNSSAVFQRLMDRILQEEIRKSCIVYVDDILIYGRTVEEHETNLKSVLLKLVKSGLKGNKEKCIFNQKEIIFLGHKISKNKIEPIRENTDNILNYKAPKDVEGIRRFLGLVNYYRKFVPHCSGMAEPLTRLLHKEHPFQWTEEQEQAFMELKEALNSKTFLVPPDFNKKFVLETDASMHGLGAVLRNVSEEEPGKPIAFISRTLTSTERKYSITEKEMLAALWAMEHFKYFLYGREFILQTDHKALEAFNSKGYLASDRIHRWMERIQNFSFEVIYRKGESIPHVDALSRQGEIEIVNQILESK